MTFQCDIRLPLTVLSHQKQQMLQCISQSKGIIYKGAFILHMKFSLLVRRGTTQFVKTFT